MMDRIIFFLVDCLLIALLALTLTMLSSVLVHILYRVLS